MQSQKMAVMPMCLTRFNIFIKGFRGYFGYKYSGILFHIKKMRWNVIYWSFHFIDTNYL